MTDKPLTAMERASKFGLNEAITSLIAAEIEKAVEEAYLDGMEHPSISVWNLAKKEAYEECAKIILETEDPMDAIGRIRAKAKELK
jgi:hypothetical protein